MINFLNDLNANIIYPIAFIMAFLISLFSTPLSKRIAFKVGAIDYPKDRGMHKKPMPRAGGTAIVFGFILTVIIIIPLLFPKTASIDIVEILGLVLGSIVIASVGFLDDIYELRPKIKLLFQFIAALIIVYTGTTISAFTWPFADNGVIFLGEFAKILTIVWVVGVTNAVNLIDGLDGLAAGVSSIAALCLMLLAILTANPVPVTIILTAALAGACLGFLPHNFNPATIFMGDTGSNFLGFALAVISIQGLLKSYTAITVIISVIVLGLPIFDTFFAIIRRLLNGQPVMQADRGHLHHRLVDRGYSQKRAVLTLYGVSGGFGIAGILFAINDVLLAVFILVVIFGVWIIDNLILRLKNSKGKNNL